MDPVAFDRTALGRDLRSTQTFALAATATGLAAVACIVLGVMHFEPSVVLAAGGLIVVQVILGLLGFGMARRPVERIKALRLPVELVEVRLLRAWGTFSLVTAILGIVGGVLTALALALLALAAIGMAGGAWGRPLRVGSRTVGARLGNGRRWADGPRPALDGLDEPTRHALGMMWLHDASKEHGSVPAFAQLTWQLAALGAPPSLLARCQRSALQEIDHAQRCFAAAETYLGTEIAVGPIPAVAPALPVVKSPARCARAVALATLEDGCLIEDLNADFAERAHALARDPAMRSLTACIAAEEREHAELAWDVLQWCLELDPEVAVHVRRRLDRLPRSIEIPYAIETMEIVACADRDALAAHGRVPFEEWGPLLRARRERTIARARALLEESSAVPTHVLVTGAAPRDNRATLHRKGEPVNKLIVAAGLGLLVSLVALSAAASGSILGRVWPGPGAVVEPNPPECPPQSIVARWWGGNPGVACFDPDDPDPQDHEIPESELDELEGQGFEIQVLEGPGGGGGSGPSY